MRPIPEGIAGDLIKAAIERYHAAERVLAEANRIPDGDPSEVLSAWACQVANDAEHHLSRAILATRDDFKQIYVNIAEKRAWPPCGVAHAGKLYLVVQSPDSDVPPGETDSDGIDVMRLMVVDQEDVLGLATPSPNGHDHDDEADEREHGPEEEEEEDEAEEDDEAPAPQPPRSDGPRPGVWNRPTPQPLLRQTLTVVPPWDTTWGPPSPVTVEVVILADGTHRDDVTASRADMPELQQAGWRSADLGVLFVYTRALM